MSWTPLHGIQSPLDTATPAGNSSVTPDLVGAATFTGATEQNNVPDIMVSCFADVAGTLYIEYSVDGTNWVTDTFIVAAGVHVTHVKSKGPRYTRVRYLNGAAAQATFRLYTYYGWFQPESKILSDTLTDSTDAQVTKSVISGDDGVNATVSPGKSLQITPPPGGVTAFNETLVGELTRITGVEFSYNLHSDIVTSRNNNGTSSIDSNRLKISTGAAANQSSQVFTNVPVKHYAGLGTLVRFTGIFTAGAAGSTQLIAIGDSGDLIGFGFNGTAYGVLIRRAGNPEIRSIQITTKSTTAENITITLDGDADATVAVTDATAGDVTTTANDIAAHDFSNLGRGWVAIPNGDTVNFISFNSESRVGTYSLSGATTAIGTASQKLAGVAPVENWIAQTAWNHDRYLQSTDPDNSPAGITLAIDKGNVFQVVFGWLGFDGVVFFIKNPVTRNFDIVHSLEYGNANLVPFIYNPTLPLCFMVENTSNTTDIIVYSSSSAGFVQGKIPNPVVRHVEIIDITLTSTTIVPILTLHNNGVFQSKLNRVRGKITSISVEVESGKPGVFEMVRDATLTGAVFAAHDANTSVMLTDTTATALADGEIIDAFPVRTAGDKEKQEEIYIEPTKFLTIAGAQATTGTNTVCKVIINWDEDF